MSITQGTRSLFQVAVVAAALTAGIRLATGHALSGVEKYCPFGGFETAWSFVTRRSFSCAAGELNFALFLALLALTIVARKAFCSWICPVGTVNEWIFALTRRLGWRVPIEPAPRVDRAPALAPAARARMDPRLHMEDRRTGIPGLRPLLHPLQRPRARGEALELRDPRGGARGRLRGPDGVVPISLSPRR